MVYEATINLFLTKAVGLILYFTPARRRARAAARDADLKFDRQWGVETSGMLIPGEADVVGSSWLHGSRYQGVCADALEQTLKELDIDFPQFTFIDFGSGKGRAVLTAGRLPFKKAVGVEYSRPLYELANRNLDVFPAIEKRASAIKFVCADAVSFPIPAGPVIVFLYNPFGKAIMSELAANVKESYLASPRRIIVLYFQAFQSEVWNSLDILHETRATRAISIYDSQVEHPDAVSVAARSESSDDLQMRQSFFELADSRIGDIGLNETKGIQTFDAPQFFEADIRDLATDETELSQIREFADFLQACIRDLGVFQRFRLVRPLSLPISFMPTSVI